MYTRYIRLDRTADGTPALNIGGGSFTNTYEARTVIRPDPSGGYNLKTALFIRTAGHLACAPDQAIVPLQIGDVVVMLHGTRPANDLNVNAVIHGYKISELTAEHITGIAIPITHAEIPKSILDGIEIYHNRDASYFCNPPQMKEV